jgi:hypothetical protein
LVLITVVGGDDDRVINVGKLDVAVLDIRDRTLSTGPGLDTDTVLTVGTATVENTNSLDTFRLATLTKGANTETVATVTVDVVQGDVGNTTVDSKTVITNSEVGVLEDDTLGGGDIQSISVLGKVATGRGSLEGNVVKNQVLRVGNTHVSSGSVDDVDTRDLGVSKTETENSRGSVVSSIVPIVIELATIVCDEE